ncbi:TspO/MBR family protein [Streptomyces sp. NPDC048301]|uniref:TspO/MBR family protein n=1 Tax=Streptomyces sp. NPDC048301 TaxID=3155631 RepID=UPI003430DB69
MSLFRSIASRGKSVSHLTPYLYSSAAVAAAAGLGAAAVDPSSGWYKGLRKPAWQPPSWAFGAVWTPLYASIAGAAGHALPRTPAAQRHQVAGALAVNLVLNAGWNWLFFKARSPKAGLVGTSALVVSNAHLVYQVGKHDRGAALALTPYAVWCCFATALNASILRRNW